MYKYVPAVNPVHVCLIHLCCTGISYQASAVNFWCSNNDKKKIDQSQGRLQVSYRKNLSSIIFETKVETIELQQT